MIFDHCLCHLTCSTSSHRFTSNKKVPGENISWDEDSCFHPDSPWDHSPDLIRYIPYPCAVTGVSRTAYRLLLSAHWLRNALPYPYPYPLSLSGLALLASGNVLFSILACIFLLIDCLSALGHLAPDNGKPVMTFYKTDERQETKYR